MDSGYGARRWYLAMLVDSRVAVEEEVVVVEKTADRRLRVHARPGGRW